jgi:hypothetical protein
LTRVFAGKIAEKKNQPATEFFDWEKRRFALRAKYPTLAAKARRRWGTRICGGGEKKLQQATVDMVNG